MTKQLQVKPFIKLFATKTKKWRVCEEIKYKSQAQALK